MKGRWRKIYSALKTPNARTFVAAWILTATTVAGALLMVATEYAGWLSYPVYAGAACSLAYTVYTIVRFAPQIKAGARATLKKNTFTRRMAENYGFRTFVFAGCSLFMNLSFVAFNTLFAFLTDNAWYGCLAGYYFLLSALRGLVFWGNRRAKAGASPSSQWRGYELCGWALFALDVAMAVAIAFMVLGQKPARYAEITAIVFAVWSVYKISLAIYNAIKAKKTKNLQIQAFRNIGLVDAAVALLSLQVTLLSTFSKEGENWLIFNAIVGACVCLFGIGVGAFMIIGARRKHEI